MNEHTKGPWRVRVAARATRLQIIGGDYGQVAIITSASANTDDAKADAAMTRPRTEGPRWLEFESYAGWVDPPAVKRDRTSRLAALALRERRRESRWRVALRRWMREAGL